MQKPWSVVQFLFYLRTFPFLESVLKQQCRLEQRLVGAVTWAAVSKSSLSLAFRRRCPFLLHFLCLVFIFRPGDTPVGFFLPTKCQVMARTFLLAGEKGWGRCKSCFSSVLEHHPWDSHLPVGRGNKYMNVAILTDNSFPSELRPNPLFSKLSKLCGRFPGMWNTNRCGWSPVTKIYTHSIYSAQLRVGMWWWIGSADLACSDVRWIRRKKPTYREVVFHCLFTVLPEVSVLFSLPYFAFLCWMLQKQQQGHGFGGGFQAFAQNATQN